MKLIIDIPDKVYNEYREGVMSMEDNCIISNAIFDGTPYEDRPQGEWIKTVDGNGWTMWGVCKCSICKTEYKDIQGPLNFCPNCGAKMKGGADNG